MYKEEKELWVKFACAALSGAAVEEIYNRKTCEAAADFADTMMELFYDKFENC